ncbi:MAG: LysM peptidoglycan-binding domain-containing protein, partial [bacterium]|nr:LysM peptidoglycan-binding domain-containing protein [bacterium]
MKQAFRFVLLIVFVMAVALPAINCGGKRQQPTKTEPPVTAVESDNSDGTLERFKPSNETGTGETETGKKTGTESGTGEQGEIFKPAPQETVPVIIPEKKPAQNPVQPETGLTDTKKTKEVADSITQGIAKIFRGFGYTGAIDVPENFKRRVAYYIRYFSENKKGVGYYRRTMKRGSRYLPMIRKVLKQKQLPLSLAYLPVIESGFSPYARSRASAVGMWQFMRGTARMYGLKVNRRIDERKDPEKSTVAAAEYLNDLLAMFGAEDPFLGISAYNAGEGKILRALRKISYKERSFWTLVKKNLLRNETDQYIPQLLAINLIASDPAKYAAASKTVPGELTPEAAESEDREIIASLHGSKVDLQSEAQGPGANESNGETNNAETIEMVKPRVTKTKVKPGKNSGSGVVLHKVRRGDTLYTIARNYRVSLKNLKKWNRLRRNRIYPGQKLKIYGSGKGSVKPVQRISSRRSHKLIYTVNYTDSLARIALFFKGVNVRDIMRWNRLRRSRIYPRQKLTLYLKKPPRKVLTHTVRRGETARKIA